MDAEQPVTPAPPYKYQPFPKMLYNHSTKKTQVVQNEAEQKALGEDWVSKAFLPDEPAPQPRRLDPIGSLADLNSRVGDLETKLEAKLKDSGSDVLELIDAMEKSFKSEISKLQGLIGGLTKKANSQFGAKPEASGN